MSGASLAQWHIFGSMRQIAGVISAAGLVMIAACNKPQPEQKMIPCQLAGATTFEPDCGIEKSSGPDGGIVTLRHPDGGFRRLIVTRDGRGVVAADGAEAASVRMSGASEIEVSLGGDRYRLPAKSTKPSSRP